MQSLKLSVQISRILHVIRHWWHGRVCLLTHWSVYGNQPWNLHHWKQALNINRADRRENFPVVRTIYFLVIYSRKMECIVLCNFCQPMKKFECFVASGDTHQWHFKTSSTGDENGFWLGLTRLEPATLISNITEILRFAFVHLGAEEKVQ